MRYSKKQAREISKSRRNKLSGYKKKKASIAISKAIINLDDFNYASNVGCYMSSYGEVDTWPIVNEIWKRGKNLFLPKIRTNSKMDFTKTTSNEKFLNNQYGIKEPISNNFTDSKFLDLVIVPLVAFDNEGNRIGMGGGYYDREFYYLKKEKKPSKPLLIGIAFDCQKLEKIQQDSWDVSLSNVF
ncbi:MAG: 5-formyltetrahydrofolate cyclo-ligase, partial [Pseudomonadota bacterium]|nr:5-formyltetrahydrofolate cyclo-ligase [Pseudomonadota bacterium]